MDLWSPLDLGCHLSDEAYNWLAQFYDAIEQAAADYPCINDKFNFEIPVSDEPLLSDEFLENLPVKITDVLPLSELPVQYLKSDIYRLQEELELLNKILIIVDTELEKLSNPE